MPVTPRAIEALRAETCDRLRALRARHGTRVFLWLIADVLTEDLRDRATADRISAEILSIAEGLAP